MEEYIPKTYQNNPTYQYGTSYGLEIINAMFPVFQKIFGDTLYKMNDCFKSVRLIQRYCNHTRIFQMGYSITYKLAVSPY